MPPKSRKKNPKRSFLSNFSTPSFLIGLTLGLVISVLIASLGNRSLVVDTEFLKTFPDIDKVFPNTRFEFPDKLESTDPERVGAPSTVAQGSAESGPAAIGEQVSNEDSPSSGENGTSVIGQPMQREETIFGTEITGYVLQAGAFSQRRAADAFRATLLLEGYEAYTKEHPDDSEVARFRVIIGPYETRQDSAEDIARLRQSNISAFLVPMTEESP